MNEASAHTARPSRLTPYVALVLTAAVPLVALAVYSQHLAGETIERQILAANRSSAEITCELVERDFVHWTTTLEGFSTLPDLVASVAARDEEAVRHRLQILVESKPRVVRAFVTDPDGLLWSDYPRAPESLGEHFDHRDWYRGLSGSWRPYVSRVYRRHAEPRPLLVAVAAPVRAPADDRVIGAIVYQVRLEGLTHLVRDIRVGSDGFVFLVDHAGVVAAHPRLELQDRLYDEYADVPPVVAARAGRRDEMRYTDPLTDDTVLATGVPCDVGGHRWVVVAQQAEIAVDRPIRSLRRQIAGGGLLLALIVGGLSVGLARSRNRLQTANRALQEVNERLAEENEQRIRAEEELQRSHAELERRVEKRTRELREKEKELLHAQKMEAVGRLAGGVAHDFNNLLSVILGYGELVLEEMSEEAPHRDQIEEIRKAGELASSLTRQLLAFSRKQILKPRVLDLNEVVEEMDKLLQPILGEDVELVTRLSPDPARISFDPGQIEQIVVNLAVNARDAMPKGGKLTLETANVILDPEYVTTHPEARAGPHVMLAISDTGTGMDEETQSRIFEPFFTTKELGRGTGLGLSTVYGIVKQADGNIWVYSEAGHGTTFKVYLPAVAEDETPVAPRKTEPVPPTGTETILVVEDEASVRELLVTVLESRGYSVLEAADADEALSRSDEHQGTIHLLVTDVVLPRLDGPKLAEALIDTRPEMKVLFMSGYTDQAILHRGVLDREASFLEKPIRPRELLRKIQAVLSEGDED